LDWTRVPIPLPANSQLIRALHPMRPCPASSGFVLLPGTFVLVRPRHGTNLVLVLVVLRHRPDSRGVSDTEASRLLAERSRCTGLRATGAAELELGGAHLHAGPHQHHERGIPEALLSSSPRRAAELELGGAHLHAGLRATGGPSPPPASSRAPRADRRPFSATGAAELELGGAHF
jgi:hypothetical protein